nr:MAG TPA: hypothetical protein [Caudoviricetes sp.]
MLFLKLTTPSIRPNVQQTSDSGTTLTMRIVLALCHRNVNSHMY